MKKFLTLLIALSLVLTTFTSCNNVDNQPLGSVNIVVEKDHDAVAAKMATGELEIAVLPEPKATASILAAKQKGYNYSIKLNLSTEWSNVSENDLPMGCIVVKNDFLKSHEGSVVDFLNEYKASIEYVGNSANKANAAQMIVSAGILPKLPIANASLDNLYGSIVYEDGSDMKTTLKAFYEAINIQSPGDSFYYTPNKNAATDKEKIKVGVMNGPTGMGMAKLINDYGADSDRYEFRLFSSPEQATAALSSGEIDLACVPTNLAANLANKANDYISVAAINCLGSLYVVVRDDVEIKSISDLKDKTVYYGVKTSTTEPILKYILEKNDLKINVTDSND